jgi:hypothetical protein
MKLTEMAEHKHHIGDFLPPHDFKKFMNTYEVYFVEIPFGFLYDKCYKNMIRSLKVAIHLKCPIIRILS